jgi:hypothetical protein
MAINVNITLYGGQIGEALAQEPEEFYYALQNIAEDESESEMRRIATDVASHASGSKATQIVQFLRILAEEIEANG